MCVEILDSCMIQKVAVDFPSSSTHTLCLSLPFSFLFFIFLFSFYLVLCVMSILSWALSAIELSIEYLNNTNNDEQRRRKQKSLRLSVSLSVYFIILFYSLKLTRGWRETQHKHTLFQHLFTVFLDFWFHRVLDRWPHTQKRFKSRVLFFSVKILLPLTLSEDFFLFFF